MRVVRETPDYIVCDDFLEPKDFELMLQYTQLQDYARDPKWMKPWDLADRPPWQSGETVYHPTKRLPSCDPRRQYPTGTALDRLIDRILIMRRGLWHKIGLVKNNAPFARCSIAGFFLPVD